MKQLLNNLSNTIHRNLIIPLVSDEFKFTENDAECSKVILKSKRRNIFAFSLDEQLAKTCNMFPFFNQSTADINKINDGIVFYINDSKIFILLIELKSNNLGAYKKQLQAGKLFVFYLLGVINNSFIKNYTIKDENIKCLVFSIRKTVRKQGTKRTNISYEHINGLNIAELECNDSHFIEKFVK
jgi:hypothetical protein